MEYAAKYQSRKGGSVQSSKRIFMEDSRAPSCIKRGHDQNDYPCVRLVRDRCVGLLKSPNSVPSYLECVKLNIPQLWYF